MIERDFAMGKLDLSMSGTCCNSLLARMIPVENK